MRKKLLLILIWLNILHTGFVKGENGELFRPTVIAIIDTTGGGIRTPHPERLLSEKDVAQFISLLRMHLGQDHNIRLIEKEKIEEKLPQSGLFRIPLTREGRLKLIQQLDADYLVLISSSPFASTHFGDDNLQIELEDRYGKVLMDTWKDGMVVIDRQVDNLKKTQEIEKTAEVIAERISKILFKSVALRKDEVVRPWQMTAEPFFADRGKGIGGQPYLQVGQVEELSQPAIKVEIKLLEVKREPEKFSPVLWKEPSQIVLERSEGEDRFKKIYEVKGERLIRINHGLPCQIIDDKVTPGKPYAYRLKVFNNRNDLIVESPIVSCVSFPVFSPAITDRETIIWEPMKEINISSSLMVAHFLLQEQALIDEVGYSSGSIVLPKWMQKYSYLHLKLYGKVRLEKYLHGIGKIEEDREIGFPVILKNETDNPPRSFYDDIFVYPSSYEFISWDQPSGNCFKVRIWDSMGLDKPQKLKIYRWMGLTSSWWPATPDSRNKVFAYEPFCWADKSEYKIEYLQPRTSQKEEVKLDEYFSGNDLTFKAKPCPQGILIRWETDLPEKKWLEGPFYNIYKIHSRQHAPYSQGSLIYTTTEPKGEFIDKEVEEDHMSGYRMEVTGVLPGWGWSFKNNKFPMKIKVKFFFPERKWQTNFWGGETIPYVYTYSFPYQVRSCRIGFITEMGRHNNTFVERYVDKQLSWVKMHYLFDVSKIPGISVSGGRGYEGVLKERVMIREGVLEADYSPLRYANFQIRLKCIGQRKIDRLIKGKPLLKGLYLKISLRDINNNSETVLLVVPLEEATEEKTRQKLIESLKDNLNLMSGDRDFNPQGEMPFKIGVLPFETEDVYLKKYSSYIKDAMEVYFSQSDVLELLEREKIDLLFKEKELEALSEEPHKLQLQGTNYIIQGALQKSGDIINLFYLIIDVKDGSVVLADKRQFAINNIEEAVKNIAQSIVTGFGQRDFSPVIQAKGEIKETISPDELDISSIEHMEPEQRFSQIGKIKDKDLRLSMMEKTLYELREKKSARYGTCVDSFCVELFQEDRMDLLKKWLEKTDRLNYIKGYIKEKEGKIDEALEYYIKATSEGYQYKKSYNALVRIFEQQQIDREGFFKKALKKDEGYSLINTPTRNNLKLCYEVFNQCPSHPQYEYLLAKELVNLGLGSLAEEMFCSFLQEKDSLWKVSALWELISYYRHENNLQKAKELIPVFQKTASRWKDREDIAFKMEFIRHEKFFQPGEKVVDKTQLTDIEKKELEENTRHNQKREKMLGTWRGSQKDEDRLIWEKVHVGHVLPQTTGSLTLLQPGPDMLTCLNRDNTVRWRIRIEDERKYGPRSEMINYGFYQEAKSVPVIGDTVFFSARRSGILLAIDLNSGKIRWFRPFWHAITNPVIIDDNIFVVDACYNVYTVVPGTGEVIKKIEGLDRWVFDSNVSYNSYVLGLIASDKKQLIFCMGGGYSILIPPLYKPDRYAVLGDSYSKESMSSVAPKPDKNRQALLEILNTGDERERLNALEQIFSNEPSSDILREIEESMVTQKDDRIVGKIITGLWKYRDIYPFPMETVFHLLFYEKPYNTGGSSLRTEIKEFLSRVFEYEAESIMEQIQKQVNSKDSQKRKEVLALVYSIYYYTGSDSLKELIKSFLRDEDGTVREEGALILARTGDYSGLDILREMFIKGGRQAGSDVFRYLLNAGDSVAVAELKRLIIQNDPYWSKNRDGLSECTSPDIIPLLISLLKDEKTPHNTKITLIDSVARIGDFEAIPVLLDLLGKISAEFSWSTNVFDERIISNLNLITGEEIKNEIIWLLWWEKEGKIIYRIKPVFSP